MPQFEQPCVDATMACDASGTPLARHRAAHYSQIARTSQETRL